MKNFLPLLLLVSLNFYLTLATQNLCDDAKAAGFTFANDPSACNRYLYCERDESDQVSVVYQMICDDPAFPNFVNDGCFSSDPLTGGVPCTEGTGDDSNENYIIKLCPDNIDLQASGIMYAIPDDAACQKYSLCRPSMTPFACTGTLLFDRNFGRCALPEAAPCGPVNAPETANCACDNPLIGSDCAIPINIAVPNSCTKYSTCFDGESIAENECAGGLHFNQAIGQCDRPDNINPPCPYTRITAQKLASLPRAQPKTSYLNPLIPQLRKMFMAKRH